MAGTNGVTHHGFWHDHEAEAKSDFHWGLLLAFILWPASLALGISLLFRQRVAWGLILITIPLTLAAIAAAVTLALSA
jgi:hypothetical protein